MPKREKPDAEIHTKIEPLADKSILISGGTSGIGRATAVLLASYGARLLIFGRHEPQLRDALQEIEQAGGEGYGLVADQANEEDVGRVFREVDEKLGGLDVMINNASVAGGSLADASGEDWRYVIQTNIGGYLACSREAITRMKQAGGGHIINVGSMSADVRGPNSVYVTSKAAIQAFSEALRKEVNALGIKVTLIEPGLTGTELIGESVERQNELKQRQELMKPEDVAVCIEYCLTQPKRMDVVEVKLRPHMQLI